MEFGDFFEEVVVCVEEEWEMWCEVVDGEVVFEYFFDVGDGIGECEGDFLYCCVFSFVYVVFWDGDGVLVWYVGCVEGD